MAANLDLTDSNPDESFACDHELAILLGTNLDDAELRFQAVVESLAEGVAIFDNSGRLVYCNPQFCNLTGYSCAEIRGRRIYEILFPVGSPEQDLYFKEMLARYSARRLGQGERYQSYIYRKNGERRWIETNAAPLRNAQGEIIGSIGANIDITEKRQIEQQLHWSQRMEAVGRLAGGVAHDFNNLLTVINGYADLLSNSFADSSSDYRRLQLIRQSAEAAGKLTSQLLTLSRKTVVQREAVDLNQIVISTAELSPHLLGQDISLEYCRDLDSAMVLGDSAQLQQVLINLMINARDSMPNGGKITIRLSEVSAHLELKGPNVCLPPGNYVLLSVEDQGHGIDAKLLPHIFEPFFTSGKKSGTGLGLSTSYALVKQLGGDILVRTALGNGSKFEVYLPRHTAEVPLRRTVTSFATNTRGSETVLVAEDETEVRRLVSEILATHGYNVLEAEDGGKALEILGQAKRKPDLLISDVIMPRLNGFELATRVMQVLPATKVILISGCTRDQELSRSIEELALPFLLKPFSPATLLRAVRVCLDENPRSFVKPAKLASN